LIIGIDGSKGAEAAVGAVAARKWPAGSEARIVNGAWTMPQLTSHRMVNPITEWIIEESARRFYPGSCRGMITPDRRRFQAARKLSAAQIKKIIE